MFLGWLFPATGLVNVRTAFEEIVLLEWGKKALDQLQGARGVLSTSYPNWFQHHLGNLLVRRGTTRWSEANNGVWPFFAPMRGGYLIEMPLVLPDPPGYHWDHGEPVNVRKHPKAVPLLGYYDAKTRKPTRWLGSGEKGKGGIGRCRLCKIRARLSGELIKSVTMTLFACKYCRVWLCPACWYAWHPRCGKPGPPESLFHPWAARSKHTLHDDTASKATASEEGEGDGAGEGQQRPAKRARAASNAEGSVGGKARKGARPRKL
jgi:hypothetical protein